MGENAFMGYVRFKRDASQFKFQWSFNKYCLKFLFQVLELEGEKGEWGFKALKQMIKINFKLVGITTIAWINSINMNLIWRPYSLIQKYGYDNFSFAVFSICGGCKSIAKWMQNKYCWLRLSWESEAQPLLSWGITPFQTANIVSQYLYLYMCTSPEQISEKCFYAAYATIHTVVQPTLFSQLRQVF